MAKQKSAALLDKTTREYTVTIRLTQEEYDRFNEVLEKLGMKMSMFGAMAIDSIIAMAEAPEDKIPVPKLVAMLRVVLETAGQTNIIKKEK